ncbi:putative cytochrome P450 [Paraphoma chrysanthemicola]|nr:putative cytochrome P450 [Paraphoma chrysanthemicola]
MLYYLFLPLLLVAIYRLVQWMRHYIVARRYRLPIILLPVSFEDLWWMPLRPLFAWVRRLPFGLGNWYLYSTMGWPTEDLNASVLKYGENFVLCSPIGNTLVSAESTVIETVYGGKHGAGWVRERGEWRMPEVQSQLFAFYGQNVSSTQGEEWKRHRRITAQAFNEQTTKRCWEETMREAGQMELESGGDMAHMRHLFDRLAMSVIMIVGFGQARGEEMTKVPEGHQETLFECLEVILQNILLTVVFQLLKVPDMFLPKVLRKLKVSYGELKLYMEESVLRHKATAQAKTSSDTPARSRSLLEAMIQANEADKSESTKTGTRPSYLTDSELYGNIFAFNLAGYETTSGTLTFAIPYLAAHPEYQDWLFDEIKHAFNPGKLPDYTTTYPSLVRCLAVMYETLRLASHPPMMIKSPTIPAQITISTPTGQHTVPISTDTRVGFNIYGAHLSPRWGPDPLSFNPKRFIATSSTGEETLRVPEGVLFAPWSLGARVCPGKKFSQVEFVAVLARIVADWRVDIVKIESVGEEEAKMRALDVLADKKFNVSVHLVRPGDVELVFVRRT